MAAEGHEAEVQAATGLILDPYFSATKFAWLLDAVPGARERAAKGEVKLGTIDSLADLEADRRRRATSPTRPTRAAPR